MGELLFPIVFVGSWILAIALTPVAWKRGWKAYALIPLAVFVASWFMPGMWYWSDYFFWFMLSSAVKIFSLAALGLLAVAGRE